LLVPAPHSSDLKSGDVISTTISGVPYTLFVDTVTSNTALTLSDVFTGPTTTGAAYVAVPQMTLNRITAALAAQTAGRFVVYCRRTLTGRRFIPVPEISR
jgi:hypothetical protein